MELVISHASAFLFWRNCCTHPASLKRVSHPRAMGSHAILTQELRAELASLGFSPSKAAPLDVLHSSRQARSQSASIRAHVYEEALPPGSLIRVSPHVLVSSPELCFAQLGASLPEMKLILAGFELCGTYALLGDNQALKQRTALTTTANIAATLASLTPRTAAAARRALVHVLDNAASPMEAKLALLLSLPKTMGGFGLPAPQLNAPVSLSAKAFALYPHSPCRADLYWPAHRLDVEYDGEDIHSGQRHLTDIARRNALEAEGLTVITIAKQQLQSDESCTQIARRIAQILEHRLRLTSLAFPDKHATARAALGLEAA